MTSQPAPEHQQERRPLWPWVVGAIVLCLFAAGFSFWWPMYRANALIRTIRENDGDVDHVETSANWRSVFGEQIHPWFHEVDTVSMRVHSLSDRDLIALTSLRGIEHLLLNVSGNSNDAIQQLANLQRVNELELIGDGHSTPSDWICTLPKLANLRLWKLEVKQQAWDHLISSRVNRLKIYNCSLDPIPTPSTSLQFLDLQVVRLNQKHSLAIQDLSITKLRIINCADTPEFWADLSKHPTLQNLELRGSDLDEQNVQSIVSLPVLTSLTLEDSRPVGLSREQVEMLGRISSLESLSFDYFELPDDHSWAAIALLPKLKHLAINDCPIGDIAASELAKSSSLEVLDLEWTEVSDHGLMKLAKLPTLKKISIQGSTNITDGGGIDFNTARPDVELGW